MSHAVLSIGSNLGDRAAHLQSAVARLERHARVRVAAVSRWYETAPAGCGPSQDAFLNGALLVETSLEPLQLLDWTQEVERQGGRRRDEVWGPRTIDIDIVLLDHAVFHSPRLELPHPRSAYRRFMIEPAAEIAPEWIHPHVGWTLRELEQFLRTTPRYAVIIGGATAERESLVQRVQARVPLRWLRRADSMTSAALRHTLAEDAANAAGEWLASDFWWNLCTSLDDASPPPLIPKLVVDMSTAGQTEAREVETIWRAALVQRAAGPRLALSAVESARQVDEVVGALQALQ